MGGGPGRLPPPPVAGPPAPECEHGAGRRPDGQPSGGRTRPRGHHVRLPPGRPGPAGRAPRRPPPLRHRRCAMSLPFDPGAAAGPWALVLGLVLAALVSEDLTCVAAGLLVAASRLDWL